MNQYRHGYSNNMTLLVNKIENRLGTRMLNLPDEIKKERWPEDIIIPDTLVTYSRYYPHKMSYLITSDHPKKDGWYLLDEDQIGGAKIIGVVDIDWRNYCNSAHTSSIYGIFDNYATNYGLQDIMLAQMNADVNSLFNTGIYPVFDPPNKIKFETATTTRSIEVGTGIPINLLVEHSHTLTTISPTQMETFESLAVCDVAGYLYNQLKFFEGLQTVYATIDLKLDSLREEYSKRDEVINYIKDSYVSASNMNQPMILCI